MKIYYFIFKEILFGVLYTQYIIGFICFLKSNNMILYLKNFSKILHT